MWDDTVQARPKLVFRYISQGVRNVDDSVPWPRWHEYPITRRVVQDLKTGCWSEEYCNASDICMGPMTDIVVARGVSEHRRLVEGETTICYCSVIMVMRYPSPRCVVENR